MVFPLYSFMKIFFCVWRCDLSWKEKVKVLLSCLLTLCNPMNCPLCSSPWNSPGKNTGVGSHSFPRDSSQTRDWTQISHIAGRFFPVWTTYWTTVTNLSLDGFVSCSFVISSSWQCVCVCVFSFLLQNPGPWLYQMHFFFILLLTFSDALFINGLSENNCNM